MIIERPISFHFSSVNIRFDPIQSMELESRSALRDWEEARAKNFSAWHTAAHRLLDNLQAAVQIGYTASCLLFIVGAYW